MPIERDRGATGDIMETLLALMIVSTGLLLLAASLPSLLSDPPASAHWSDDVTSLLVEDGVLDLPRAELTVRTLPEGTAVRLITADGASLYLLERLQPTDGDRFVTRTPVLVRTATVSFPAILEVACAG